jgi:glycosyltransferase involved in cell wall biosynthesis/GT2 family glycosyltransferase/tetratricopeptide (TPR) repeat protein
MNNKPFFSVVIPVYNQGELLREAIDSIINQTFTDWEILIVNDGSTDNTKAIMEEYAAREKRIRCFYKENGGTASALNMGIKNTLGEWICWLSSDDMYEPDKLEIHEKYIRKYPSIKFFYSHFYYYNDETKEKTEPGLWFSIPPREFQVSHFFLGNYVHGNSFAAHRSVFEKVGMFDATLRQGQDFDMWLRIAAKFESFYINKRTCITRFHAGQDTNAFPDGMYYDSARSCINFLNRAKLKEIFPLLNLKSEHNFLIMISKVVELSTNTDCFMYRLGFMPILIDRLNEWLSEELTIESQKNVRNTIKSFFESKKNKNLPKEIENSLQKLYTPGHFKFHKYDIYSNILKYIDKLLEEGDRETAAKLEHYLNILFTKRETTELDFVKKNKEYHPKIFGFPKNEEYKQLPYDCLVKWRVEPITFEGVFSHDINLKCPECGTVLRHKQSLLEKPEPELFKIACHNCHSGFTINESEIHKYITAIAVKEPDSKKNTKANAVAFIVRGIHGKSGGTKVFSKYIQWLDSLGIKVHTFSDGPKPEWFDIPGTFTRVKDYEDIVFPDVDFVMVYNLLDSFKIIDKIPLSKIIYTSQAYGGFLYGRDFNSLREDKALYHSVYSLPVKIFAISKHLKEFIDGNFNKEAFYIPNFVDHGVFNKSEREFRSDNTVLFVGDPFQPLKGLNYILAALKNIQASSKRIPGLKFVIATGIANAAMQEKINDIKKHFDFKISFLTGLSDRLMADLINSVSLYICSSWYEGFSLSVLEAMACGTPVIATRNRGAESFCENGKNAFLVDYGDVNLLSSLIIDILSGKYDLTSIRFNAYQTSREYSESNTKQKFGNVFSRLFEHELKFKDEKQELLPLSITPKEFAPLPDFNKFPRLAITYLVDNIGAVTGGNQTLLAQIKVLTKRGHKVTVLSHSERPSVFESQTGYVKVPLNVAMDNYIEQCDVLISTYFTNTKYLPAANAKVKIFYSQGDQYIFEDNNCNGKIADTSFLKTMEDESKQAYKYENIKIVANSGALAKQIEARYSRKIDGILNVGVDGKIFHPLQKSFEGSKLRILLVGPDNLGSYVEPLGFKGMEDAKKALLAFKNLVPDFTLVRISNSKPEIFKDFPCEFYFNPDDELKTFLFGTADVLIYPSHYESWGLPPLEAMAAGTAVICTSNPGSMEYCRNEENCLVVPIKSPDSIVKALLRIVQEKGLSARLSTGGIITAGKYTKDIEFFELEKMLYCFVNPECLNNDRNNSSDLINLIRKANEMLQDKLFDKALELLSGLDYCEYHSPDDIEVLSLGYYIKGYAHFILNDFESAKTNYETALKLNPASSMACLGLAEIFFNDKQLNEAKTMYEWSINNDATNCSAVEGLAKVNSVLGLAACDNSLIKEMVSNKSVQDLLNDAYCYFEENNLLGAADYLENCNEHVEDETMENSSSDVASFFNMKGFVYLGLNDSSKAKENFEKALNTNPKSSQACVGLGEIFLLNEQYDAARTMFEWGIKNNPENVVAVEALANLDAIHQPVQPESK